MQTLNEFEFALKRGLGEIARFEEEPWIVVKSALRQKPMLWEKEVGRLCIEAERRLNYRQLCQLKRTLKISEHQWRLYKWRFEHFPPDSE